MRYNFAKAGLVLALLATSCLGQDNASSPAPAPSAAITAPKPTPRPMSEQPLSAFTQLGASFALSARIGELDWNEEQFQAFVSGLTEGYHHRHLPFDDRAAELYAAMSARVQELDRKKQEEQFQDPKYLEKYMRETRRTLNMQQTDSGLCYMVQGIGGSNRPTLTDTVVISYDVTSSDLQRPVPQLSASRLHAKVSDLMPGLAEAVQMMTADAKGVFILPPALSYGAGKWPDGVEKNSPLIFRITLHEIEAPAAPSS